MIATTYPVRPVTISALGVVSWDELYRVDHYPAEASFSMMSESQSAPGGTTGNLAMTARRLGAAVRFFTKVGTDRPGDSILESYRSAGIEMADIIVDPGETDLSVVIVSRQTSERTILWRKAPYLKRGDKISIDRLFGSDVAVLDCVDLDLRRFLTDLPAHTMPKCRLLGPLNYLVDVVADDKIDIALRHDVIIGNQTEFRDLTGSSSGEGGLSEIQKRMKGSNCRLAIMTSGINGSSAVSADAIWHCAAHPVGAVDTTGAGDAFAGAVAFGLAQRWAVADSLAFASAVSARVVSTLGAQAGLPDLGETLFMLENRS